MLLSSDEAPYGVANEAHVRASAEALSQLADIMSSPAPGADPFYAKIGLYEHGGFLSPVLYGVVLYIATGVEEVGGPPDPVLGSEAPAHTLFLPTETDPDHPFTYAVVANHPVEAQLRHTLATFARLLARQELVSGLDADRFANLDQLAALSDAESDRFVSDLIRAEGWQAAARAIRDRAEAAGLPLRVSFTGELFDRDQLAARAPLLRRIYNQNSAVREAIDKVTATLSQGLTVVGGGKQSFGAFARDYLDLGLIRTYLAHLARDAFVCGNGYLSFGTVPAQDLRLLPPENVSVVGEGVLLEKRDGAEIRHDRILHVPGSKQQHSPYGISILEPFVGLQAQHDLLTRAASLPAAWSEGGAPQEMVDAAKPTADLAARTLRAIEDQTGRMFGAAQLLRAAVPPDMYFPIAIEMRPAAQRIAIRPAAVEHTDLGPT